MVSSVCISVDSPEHDIIFFNIPVNMAKKNKINAQGLINLNRIIENLPFECDFFYKERNGRWRRLSRHTNDIYDYHGYIFLKKAIIKVTLPISKSCIDYKYIIYLFSRQSKEEHLIY